MKRNLILRRDSPLIRGVSLLVLAGFVFSTTAAPFAQGSLWEERRRAAQGMREKKEKTENAFTPDSAARSDEENRRPAEGPSGASRQDWQRRQVGEVKPLGLLGMEIPEELGTVAENNAGRLDLAGGSASLPLVVHIQDAHGYYGAQKNSAAILKLLAGSSGKPLEVCVEGAWEDVDTSWLAAFPDEKVKQELVEDLLKEGEITGEEYLSILAGGKAGSLHIFGVEDETIYRANLKSREMMDGERERMLAKLETLSRGLEKAKGGLFRGEIRELDAAAGQYEAGKAGLQEYFGFLKKLSGGGNAKSDGTLLDWTRYLNLYVLNDLMRMEAELSTRKVEEERKHLIQVLQEKLDQGSMMQLSQVTLGYRMGKVTGRRYHEGLIRLAQVNSVDVPEMEKYVKYLARSEELNGEGASKEISELTEAVAARLSGGDAALAELWRVSRLLRMEKKFWQEKFSPKDWEEYRKQTAGGDGGLREIENYLRKEGNAPEMEEWPAEADLLSLPPKRRYGFLTHGEKEYLQEAYYKLAFKRNEVMVEKALARAKAAKAERVVLIAGGFHTEGMLEILRQKGAPYVVIRPKLTPARAGQEKKQEFDRPAPDRLDAFVRDYARKLEELKDWKNTPKDRRIDRVIEVVKDRLSFAGPLEKEGRLYLLGAYQGDRSRVNFVMEYQQSEQNPEQFASGRSPDFDDALKAAMGTLRMMSQLVGSLQLSEFSPLIVKFLGRLWVLDKTNMRLTGVRTEEFREFLLQNGPFTLEGNPAAAKTALEKVVSKLSGLRVAVDNGKKTVTFIEKKEAAKMPTRNLALAPASVLGAKYALNAANQAGLEKKGSLQFTRAAEMFSEAWPAVELVLKGDESLSARFKEMLEQVRTWEKSRLVAEREGIENFYGLPLSQIKRHIGSFLKSYTDLIQLKTKKQLKNARRPVRENAASIIQEALDVALDDRDKAYLKRIRSPDGDTRSLSVGGAANYQSDLDRIDKHIAPAVKIQDEDQFLDAGSGIGIVSLYFAIKYGINSYGIEYDEGQHMLAEKLKRYLVDKGYIAKEQVTFINGDLTKTDFSPYTVVYYHSPFFDKINHPVNQAVLHGVIQKMPAGSRFIQTMIDPEKVSRSLGGNFRTKELWSGEGLIRELYASVHEKLNEPSIDSQKTMQDKLLEVLQDALVLARLDEIESREQAAKAPAEKLPDARTATPLLKLLNTIRQMARNVFLQDRYIYADEGAANLEKFYFHPLQIFQARNVLRRFAERNDPNRLEMIGEARHAKIAATAGLFGAAAAIFAAATFSWQLLIPATILWMLASGYVFSGAHKGRSGWALFAAGSVLAGITFLPAIAVSIFLPILFGSSLTVILLSLPVALIALNKFGMPLNVFLHEKYNLAVLDGRLPSWMPLLQVLGDPALGMNSPKPGIDAESQLRHTLANIRFAHRLDGIFDTLLKEHRISRSDITLLQTTLLGTNWMMPVLAKLKKGNRVVVFQQLGSKGMVHDRSMLGLKELNDKLLGYALTTDFIIQKRNEILRRQMLTAFGNRVFIGGENAATAVGKTLSYREQINVDAPYSDVTSNFKEIIFSLDGAQEDDDQILIRVLRRTEIEMTKLIRSNAQVRETLSRNSEAAAALGVSTELSNLLGLKYGFSVVEDDSPADKVSAIVEAYKGLLYEDGSYTDIRYIRNINAIVAEGTKLEKALPRIFRKVPEQQNRRTFRDDVLVYPRKNVAWGDLPDEIRALFFPQKAEGVLDPEQTAEDNYRWFVSYLSKLKIHDFIPRWEGFAQGVAEAAEIEKCLTALDQIRLRNTTSDDHTIAISDEDLREIKYAMWYIMSDQRSRHITSQHAYYSRAPPFSHLIDLDIVNLGGMNFAAFHLELQHILGLLSTTKAVRMVEEADVERSAADPEAVRREISKVRSQILNLWLNAADSVTKKILKAEEVVQEECRKAGARTDVRKPLLTDTGTEALVPIHRGGDELKLALPKEVKGNDLYDLLFKIREKVRATVGIDIRVSGSDLASDPEFSQGADWDDIFSSIIFLNDETEQKLKKLLTVIRHLPEQYHGFGDPIVLRTQFQGRDQVVAVARKEAGGFEKIPVDTLIRAAEENKLGRFRLAASIPGERWAAIAPILEIPYWVPFLNVGYHRLLVRMGLARTVDFAAVGAAADTVLNRGDLQNLTRLPLLGGFVRPLAGWTLSSAHLFASAHKEATESQYRNRLATWYGVAGVTLAGALAAPVIASLLGALAPAAILSVFWGALLGNAVSHLVRNLPSIVSNLRSFRQAETAPTPLPERKTAEAVTNEKQQAEKFASLLPGLSSTLQSLFAGISNAAVVSALYRGLIVVSVDDNAIVQLSQPEQDKLAAEAGARFGADLRAQIQAYRPANFKQAAHLFLFWLFKSFLKPVVIEAAGGERKLYFTVDGNLLLKAGRADAEMSLLNRFEMAGLKKRIEAAQAIAKADPAGAPRLLVSPITAVVEATRLVTALIWMRVEKRFRKEVRSAANVSEHVQEIAGVLKDKAPALAPLSMPGYAAATLIENTRQTVVIALDLRGAVTLENGTVRVTADFARTVRGVSEALEESGQEKKVLFSLTLDADVDIERVGRALGIKKNQIVITARNPEDTIAKILRLKESGLAEFTTLLYSLDPAGWEGIEELGAIVVQIMKNGFRLSGKLARDFYERFGKESDSVKIDENTGEVTIADRSLHLDAAGEAEKIELFKTQA